MHDLTKERGISLVETVIFILIVAVAVSAVSLQFSQNVRHSADPLIRQKAITLANAYLDEMAKKAWDDNTPSGGGCVETGSGYCSNFCSRMPISDCGAVCQKVAGVCTPAATVAGIGTEEAGRSAYDDIDDYHDPGGSAPSDANGNPLSGFENFSVAVSVTQPGGAWLGIPANDVRLIELSVTTPGNETLRFTQYRVNF